MGKKRIITKGGEVSESVPQAAAKSAQLKTGRRVTSGIAHVQATYNNTVITVTDEKGNVVAWSTAGSLGFTGPKKATPFASAKVISALAEKLQKSGPVNVHVFVSGIGGGRDSALRSLANRGFNILSI